MPGLTLFGCKKKYIVFTKIKKLKKIGILCPAPEGRPKCDWVIVDAGSIIVHLFRQEIRDLYSLEKLWNINFDNIKTKLIHIVVTFSLKDLKSNRKFILEFPIKNPRIVTMSRPDP